MSKTIKQIADELGVSKQAVTKCIDNLGLRSSLTKNGNSFLVGDSQEAAIKAAFSSRSATKNANQNANQSPTELAILIQTLQASIDTLKEQLTIKDELIKSQQAFLATKDEQINQLTAAVQQQTAALESTTAALTAAQALHAGTIQERLKIQNGNAQEDDDFDVDSSHVQELQERVGFFARIFGKKRK